MGGHGIARSFGFELRVPNLKFEKSGDEIRMAIDSRITELTNDNANDVEEVKKIAKDRGVETEEVLAAGDDESLVQAYSTKAMNNAPRASTLVRQLEEDLMKMRRYAANVATRNVMLGELARVKKNIQSTRKFDLSFDEICTLGF